MVAYRARLSRRRFLGASAVALLGGCSVPGSRVESEPSRLGGSLDIHVHLFGTGDAGSGCLLSEVITGGLVFKSLVGLLRVKERAPTFDEGYVAALIEQVRESSLDRVALVAHDAVYDARGKLDGQRTHVYVPNDYVFEVVARYPELLLPCPSINPNRRDALEELDRCHTRGARILKIHPPIQGVDVAERKHAKFFARCAELGIIVMVHTGHEHSAPVIDIGFSDPRRLRLALEEGCTVVACHCGTGRPDDEPDFLPGFVEMARTYERLWGDTAILGVRARDVARLLAEEDVVPRLLHGSDFPFPAQPLLFHDVIGAETALQISQESNLLDRDLALKEALGFGRASAERASGLLDKFVTRRSPRATMSGEGPVREEAPGSSL